MEKRRATVGVNYAVKNLTPQLNVRIKKIRSDGTSVNMDYKSIGSGKSVRGCNVISFKRV